MKQRLFLWLFFLMTLSGLSFGEEGMYPISEIHRLDLQSKGLEISAKDIYNPNGISLIDAICKVGGCTGSFVSPQGLIITNHHCAYRAVQRASSTEHDYLANGFLAKTKEQELPATGYTVRITDSYRDVSEEVLSAVNDDMDYAERAKAIERKIKEIVTQTEKENPGKRAEIAEMFIGKSYVLFIYTYLKDIRLVYVPPRSIGNFGGEVDNWMWPRHTGDFSFMRAYVAPDGSPAEYSPENVPYRPKKFLKINPDGVNEEDFVFILGYPGKTYRHRTSHFLAYEKEIRMPFVVDWYQYQIDVMEKMGKNDREIQLKLAGRIKGLSNVMKNYRGKLKGLNRLNIVEKKRQEEAELQKFIEADKNRKAKYGSLLQDIGAVYDKIRAHSQRSLILSYLRRSSLMLNWAYTIYEAAIERQKDDLERKSAYMDRNFKDTIQRIKMNLKSYHEPTERILLKQMLLKAANLPPEKQIPVIKNILKGKDTEKAIDSFIERAFSQSKLADDKFLTAALEKSPDELKKSKDPFIQLAIELYPSYQELEKLNEEINGELNKLYGLLIDVKKDFLKTDFVPDANRTLRLTYGHIRGYSPADAVYYKPITSTNGVLEKTTGKPPFDPPKKLITLIKNKNFGQFYRKSVDGVPVDILYDTDTTGGNSGSPILNARGELVGVNFDRAFEATINDFAWDESYSRSIGVDIRYVLWVAQKFGGAENILQEIGAKK